MVLEKREAAVKKREDADMLEGVNIKLFAHAQIREAIKGLSTKRKRRKILV